MTNLLGTARDSEDLRTQLRQIQEGTSNIARETSAALKKLESLPPSNPNELAARKVQMSKLKGEFQTALQQLQAASQIALGKERDTLKKVRADNDVTRKPAVGREPQPYAPQDEERAPLFGDDHHQQRMLDQQVDFNTGLIHEREEAIREIEAAMTEVNEIYKDLNVLVIEQGERLDTIEDNMASADERVQEGVVQLKSAQKYQKSAKKKICCLLVIVAIIAAVMVLILLEVLKK